MSLLFGATERRDDLAATELLYQQRRASMTSSGVMVTEERASRHSAVWSCRAAVAEALQQCPPQEVETGSGTPVRRLPPEWMDEPAPGIPFEMWIWQQAWTLAAEGKAYGWVVTDQLARPTAVLPIDPSVVVWKFHKPTKSWTVKVDGEETKLWPLGPLWHCPMYATPGRPEGLSPIRFHAETIGVGLAAQEFGGQFFRDGGHPTMIVQPEKDPGTTGVSRLKASILNATRGNREPLVIPQSVKMERWQVAPDESQFLDTMRYSGEDIARIFGVPPTKIGLATSGSNQPYTNVADANTDWRVSGLSRYVVPLEAALSTLLPGGRARRIRFDFSAFLRADPAKRAAFYKAGAEIGSLSGTPLLLTNEMRAEEGLPPLPGGDVFLRPKQPEPPQTRSADPTGDAHVLEV